MGGHDRIRLRQNRGHPCPEAPNQWRRRDEKVKLQVTRCTRIEGIGAIPLDDDDFDDVKKEARRKLEIKQDPAMPCVAKNSDNPKQACQKML